ncbi:MAG: Ig-like domain-containing protein [Desulfuromonadaceae bacterium]|nr:Ig-like domain-containing protein [Desulfuromonadaceae bacterium]MDD2848956.1 Ig-like domain-containing protein [Desulfuromonadaceae bacterium]MDD4130305.1 Ig-like domain-containing protein [Desulfuromonadaceae bacterium]
MKCGFWVVTILLQLMLSAQVALAVPHSITTWRENKPAALSLTFDDGYYSQYEKALPALNARGFKGTFFIFTDYSDYFNLWDRWAEAATMGHEIASHTKTHPYLTTLPLSEAEYEITVSQTLIDAKITGQKSLSFAYPYGDLNTAVKALVQKSYIGARGVKEALNDASTDSYNTLAFDVVNSDVLQMKALTEQAVSQQKWLIPIFHGFSPDEYGGWNSDQLISYLDYLKGRADVWVAPFGTVIKYLRERGTAALSVATQSGDMITLNLTDTLDNTVFDCPLTVRSEVPWTTVRVQQGNGVITTLASVTEAGVQVVYYDAVPDSGIITLTNGAVSQSVVATNDSYTVNTGTVLNQTAPGVLGNDTAPAGVILAAQLVSGTSHGTLTLNSNGSFLYTPLAGYVGSDSFTYRANDGTTNSNIATVTIAATSLDRILLSDDFTRVAGAPAPLSPWTSVLGSWAVSSGVLQGSGSALSYSQIYYTPTPLWTDYSVEGRFQFPATGFGGGLGCRVNPATGAQYSAWIFPGTNVMKLGKLWSWSEYSGTSMAEASLPAIGTGFHTLKMVCNGPRIQVYFDGIAKVDVTDNNYDTLAPYLSGGVGAALFTASGVYAMTVDNVVVTRLDSNNLSPVAVNDSYSTAVNTALNQAAPGVLANDSDPEGAALTAQLVSGPSHGTLTLNSSGSFAYTPLANYIGSDSFTYLASDGATGSNTATVTIQVTSTALFADDFTRAPGTTAPLLPWATVSGTWTVANGVLQGSGAALSYSQLYYAPAALWDNYSVQGRFKFAATAFGGGLGCRVNPATGAHYAAWIYPDNSAAGHNMLVLGKMWSWTTFGAALMGQVSLPSVGTGFHTLRMVCNGSRIQVYYDGAAKIDVTDNNFDSRAPYVSGGIAAELFTYGAAYTMTVDDVVVNSLF